MRRSFVTCQYHRHFKYLPLDIKPILYCFFGDAPGRPVVESTRLGVLPVVPYWIPGQLPPGYNRSVSTSCQTHRDLRSAYGEAVETLRSAMLILGDAAGFPDEPEIYTAAQEQVVLERGKCESLLKALKLHLNQHQCAPARTTAWTATHPRSPLH